MKKNKQTNIMASGLIFFARITKANNQPRSLLLLWLWHSLIGGGGGGGSGVSSGGRIRRVNRELRHSRATKKRRIGREA